MRSAPGQSFPAVAVMPHAAFDMAMNHLSRLPLKDRPVFIGAAARKGLFLTMEETRLAREAKDALMAELALEY